MLVARPPPPSEPGRLPLKKPPSPGGSAKLWQRPGEAGGPGVRDQRVLSSLISRPVTG